MKILAINTSHRGKNGYTEFLINKIFEGADSVGAECEIVRLSEHDVKRCTGCFNCQKKETLFKCIYDEKDDARIIYDKMKHADIIIYATPVYIFNMSGLLKNFLDRFLFTSNSKEFLYTKSELFFHHIDRDVCSKPFVLLICQDNVENETHKNIISYFKTFSRFMDAKQVGTLVRKSGIVAGHGKDEAKLNEYPELINIYNAFIQAGKELATLGKIHRSTEKRASKGIVKLPVFVKILMKFKFFRKQAEVKIGKAME